MKKITENGIDFYQSEADGYLTESQLTDESARSFGKMVQAIPGLEDYWRDATQYEKDAWDAEQATKSEVYTA